MSLSLQPGDFLPVVDENNVPVIELTTDNQFALKVQLREDESYHLISLDDAYAWNILPLTTVSEKATFIETSESYVANVEASEIDNEEDDAGDDGKRLSVDKTTGTNQQTEELNIIEKSERATLKQCVNWSDAAVEYMLLLLKEFTADLKSDKKKRMKTFQEISSKLKEFDRSFNFNAQQCRDKYFNLRKTFNKKWHNMKNDTGASEIRCKFFNEMYELWGEKPNTNPIAPVSSMKPAIIGATPSTSNAEIRKPEKRGKEGKVDESEPKAKKKKNVELLIREIKEKNLKAEKPHQETRKIKSEAVSILREIKDTYREMVKILREEKK